MFTARCLAFVVFIAATSAAVAEKRLAPQLGKPITNEQAQAWNLNVFPDGTGLPPGRGTASDGRVIFEAQCVSCHGEGGRGNTAEELIGEPLKPTKDNPSKVIGAYWPYATTIYDFIRRSMPPTAPGSLSSDQVYALVAYLLSANGIISATAEVSQTTLAKVQMPNRDGFIWIDVKPRP